MREAIVFEDNGLGFVGENGIEPADDAVAAAHVFLGIKARDRARPVDGGLGEEGAGIGDFFGFAWLIGTGGVSDDVKAWGPGGADACEDLGGGVGAAENDECDGGVHVAGSGIGVAEELP